MLAPSPLDLSLGGIEVGVHISSLLYGILNVQIYRYARTRRQDAVVIKCLVALVWRVLAVGKFRCR